MTAQHDEPVQETAAPAQYRESVRLIDCFMEIIGYTRYLLPRMGQNPPAFDRVRDHYQTLFEQSQEKARASKLPTVEWKKACFPVCAWVDERLLCSEWPDKGKWQSHQLQVRFFKTTNAGDAFFTRLDQLKDKDTDIREVYLYCLSLGFTGKLFKETDALHLAEIRADNLLQLFPEDEAMSLPPELFPEGYTGKRSEKKRWKRGLPPAFIAGLVIPPLTILLLYAAFSLHLAGMTHQFTRNLESPRWVHLFEPPERPMVEKNESTGAPESPGKPY